MIIESLSLGVIATLIYTAGAWIIVTVSRYLRARRFVGEWRMMVIVNRQLQAEKKAGTTTIKIPRWCEPLHLTAEAYDINGSGNRPHVSTIRIDSADMRRAVRILEYADGQFEADAQEWILLQSGNILARSDAGPVHVLKRIEKPTAAARQ